MINVFFPLVLQLLVVVSSDWNAVDGTLYCYERSTSSLEWTLSSPPIPVTLGKQGMAWGRGMHDLDDTQTFPKKEGDRRSPAGIFSLGSIFGDALHQQYSKNMPFLLITDDLECVDDSNSVYYNQLVRANSIEKKDWKSSEKMASIGFLYALGLVIEHNVNPVEAGMGSAIFMHIWRGQGLGTLGCTAMEEKNLNEIVSWLDREKNPCLVQLPIEEYNNKKSKWGLPELP
jgi:L,D-peptidoglycan transpeptidase YkuD (ErfK/YbiS/YcfS/YnhG family)